MRMDDGNGTKGGKQRKLRCIHVYSYNQGERTPTEYLRCGHRRDAGEGKEGEGGVEFEMRAKGEWRGGKEGGPLSLPLSVSKGDLFLSGRMMRTTRTNGGVGVTAAVRES